LDKINIYQSNETKMAEEMLTPVFSFHKPPTWNSLALFEKIAYYKTQLDHRYAPYVDKLEAKRLVSIMCPKVRTARVIRILKDSNDICKADICPEHLLKATHGSGWNVLLKKAPPIPKLQTILAKWSVPYVGSGEKQYAHIPPRFFIEEIIDDLYTGKSGQARVFMVRCIHGQPVSVGVRQGNGSTVQNTYTPAFIPQDRLHFELEKPAQWDAMMEHAATLSKPFEFVRVDFYIGRNSDIYFSEFTFTPAGGNRVFPMAVEHAMGRLWTARQSQ
jgi:hypothetical protein